MMKEALKEPRHQFALSLILVALGFALSLTWAPRPVIAQFSAQGTWIPASSVGGTANAVTLTIPNITAMADILGVPLRFFPANANSGAVTINPSGLGAEPVRLKTPYGLVALNSGEEIPTVVTTVTWDGTYFEQDVKGIAAGTVLVETSSGSYSPPTTLAYVDATAIGAGGGGGGSASTASNTIAVGGGGGGGGVCSGVFLYSSVNSLSFTIGAAGTGGVGSSTGGTGGTTSFGGILSASGGSGGSGGAAGTQLSQAGGNGGACGTGTIPLGGSAGGLGSGSYASSTAYFTASGSGAPGYQGAGAGRSPITSGSGGNAGTSFGAGGSGAASSVSTPGNETGGAGFQGALILKPYLYY